MVKTKKTFTQIMLLLGTVITFTAAVFLAADFWKKNAKLEQTGLKRAWDHINKSDVTAIRNALTRYEALTQNLAKELQPGNIEYKKETIEAFLMQKAGEYGVHGISAAWEPHVLGEDTFDYIPMALKKEGRYILTYLDENPDYTDDWYARSMKSPGGSLWTDPHVGTVTQTYHVEYTSVIIDPKTQKRIGVARLAFSLDDISGIMKLLHVNKFGYSWLLAENGDIAYHPNQDLIVKQNNILKAAEEQQNSMVAEVYRRASRGESGVVEYRSPFSNIRGYLLYCPVNIAGWTLYILINRNFLRLDSEFTRKRWMGICALLVLAFSFLALLVFKNQWLQITVISVVLTLGMGGIWHLVANLEKFPKNTIHSERELQHKMKEITGISKTKYRQVPTFVPTGLFVQSLEFLGANNVQLTGYIWQRYTPDMPAGIDKGFVFPEAIDFDCSEAYSHTEKGVDTVKGWYFKVTLRQRFDYSKFPLSIEDLWVRIWHKDFHKNIYLVPDLGAYMIMEPATLPGIEKDFVLQGWDLRGSYFNFHENSYNTDFGLSDYRGQQGFDELYFNIVLARNLLDTFIAHLIPLIVVAVLVFLSFLKTTRESENPLSILAIAAGLFFVVIFDHIGLRNQLMINGVVYIEYFYFCMYTALMALSVNAFLYAGKIQLRFIQDKDNLKPRLLFWPLLLGVLYVISMVTYY